MRLLLHPGNAKEDDLHRAKRCALQIPSPVPDRHTAPLACSVLLDFRAPFLANI
jgi:hypothetical protein